MEKAKIDEFLTLRLISPKGVWGEGSQQKIKADFLSKFNFLLNALVLGLKPHFLLSYELQKCAGGSNLAMGAQSSQLY